MHKSKLTVNWIGIPKCELCEGIECNVSFRPHAGRHCSITISVKECLYRISIVYSTSMGASSTSRPRYDSKSILKCACPNHLLKPSISTLVERLGYEGGMNPDLVSHGGDENESDDFHPSRWHLKLFQPSYLFLCKQTMHLLGAMQ